MNVIALEEQAFRQMVDTLVAEIKQQLGAQQRDKWVDGDEAMRLMRISSKTTLQKLRDEDKIRFSQPERKILLYDRDSIDEWLDKHANKPSNGTGRR